MTALTVELGFELELVDIDGDRSSKPYYREHLPVVEVDGAQAFTYFVEPGALRARLRALSYRTISRRA